MPSRRINKVIFGGIIFVLFLLSFKIKTVGIISFLAITCIFPGEILSRGIKLSFGEKIAFFPLFGITFSTAAVYFLSLAFGYSRSLLFYFSLALILGYFISIPFDKEAGKVEKKHLYGLILSLGIFALSLWILWVSVWNPLPYGISITGSNWQDTPMHYALIESINCGNFPPRMPYFSSSYVHYHFFFDFYNAMVEKFSGGFFPKLLPFLNAYMIFLYSYSLFLLSCEVFGLGSGLISSSIGVFGWGFQYYLMFSALAGGKYSPYGDYIYQYGGLFGLPPIYDNLLQQRPLIVGLALSALSAYFLLSSLRERSPSKAFLAGILVSLGFPFHVFVPLFSSLLWLLLMTFHRRDSKPLIYYLIPLPLTFPFYFTVFEAYHARVRGPLWYFSFVKGNPVEFFLLNLGIPLVACFVSLPFLKEKRARPLYVLALILFLVPLLVCFTPNPWDMYKFYMFFWIPASCLSGAMFYRLFKARRALKLAFGALLILSCLDVVPVVQYNVETHYLGLTYPEFEAGIWVREDTPKKAVFLTLPTIYCPVTMVGGRLRVLGYVNWAYGHGVPLGEIFKAAELVNKAYYMESALKEVIKEYNVSYVYLGPSEESKYPGAYGFLSSLPFLKEVYSHGEIHIFKVVKVKEKSGQKNEGGKRSSWRKIS